MRVLTEQTLREVQQFCRAAGFDDEKVGVSQLMGGVDTDAWHLYPERESVLIGTQDMLLSRALNRGYASGRARWPMEFGLLSQDALWVFDEVQLMDVGLATSAQLQAYRDDEREKQLRPIVSWWMSATLQPEWLRTVDTRLHHSAWSLEPIRVVPSELQNGPSGETKALSLTAIGADHPDALADRVVAEHQSLANGPYGRVTLAVCNTVDRACALHTQLLKRGRTTEDTHLVHSRFRSADRANWAPFLRRDSCVAGVDRIIVATQVVEAGVDISAGCLLSDLAPWPSLVQRFGRCARYGGAGKVVVVDRGRDQPAPYDEKELETAWETLQRIDDAGIASLEELESALPPEELRALYPYDPPHLLLRKEYDELFDTTPDLTGADLDIARFIRSGDDRDCLVCWHDWSEGRPEPSYQPLPSALCRVPVRQAESWLKKKKVAELGAPHVFDYLSGDWRPLSLRDLRPGRLVVVRTTAGGYDPRLGFTGEVPRKKSSPVPPIASPIPSADQRSDLSQDDESLSALEDRRVFQTIATHGGQVAELARELARRCGLDSRWQQIFDLAGRLHDWGKAHPAFASNIIAEDKPDRCDLAKAPAGADSWKARSHLYEAEDGQRRGFRHELASVLACFELLARHDRQHAALLGDFGELIDLGVLAAESVPEDTTSAIGAELAGLDADSFDLVAYLIAAHHGKLRASWHASPQDQEFRQSDDRGLPLRGVRDGDEVPELPLLTADGLPDLTPTLSLHLAPATLGLSARYGRSWRERTLALQARLGPCALAWLESLLRAADVRASREPIADSLLDEVSA